MLGARFLRLLKSSSICWRGLSTVYHEVITFPCVRAKVGAPWRRDLCDTTAPSEAIVSRPTARRRPALLNIPDGMGLDEFLIPTTVPGFSFECPYPTFRFPSTSCPEWVPRNQLLGIRRHGRLDFPLQRNRVNWGNLDHDYRVSEKVRRFRFRFLGS